MTRSTHPGAPSMGRGELSSRELIGENTGVISGLVVDESASVPRAVVRGSGLRCSRIVLGTSGWSRGSLGAGITAETAEEVLTAYREAGGFTIESSDGDAGASQRLLGSGLSAVFDRGDVVIIASSGAAQSSSRGADLSRRALMASLDATLERLGCEHVDLWLVDGDDGCTPISEVAGALAWAVQTGRATYVGARSMAAWRTVDLFHHLKNRGVDLCASVDAFNLLDPSARDDVLPAAASCGYGFIAGAGLAGGVLTGKYRHGTPTQSRRASVRSSENAAPQVATHSSSGLEGKSRSGRAIVESLATAADGLGVHPSELALAWALNQPDVDALCVGVRNQQQLATALRAPHLSVPREIVNVLNEVSRGEGV